MAMVAFPNRPPMTPLCPMVCVLCAKATICTQFRQKGYLK